LKKWGDGGRIPLASRENRGLMPHVPMPFEPTRSYVYKASRYELLPRIAEIARGYGDKPFLLRDLTKQVLTETYTHDQLEIRIKKAESDKTEKMRNIFGFYIPFLAQNLNIFERVGGGMYNNVSIDEEMAEADAVATDVDSDDEGIIYAYSFPLIRKSSGKFPIKIGLTVTGDAKERVAQQCKGSSGTCCFEHPVMLKTWEVQKVAAVEDAIHSTLEARGAKRDSPGDEWFDTTVEEIESIVKFVQPSINGH
jgi:hypothetical protein